MGKLIRVSVDFTPEAWKCLKSIERMLGVSHAEALGRSLGLTRYVLKQMRRGKTIEVVSEGSRLQITKV